MATTAEGAVRGYSGNAVKTSLSQDINESVATINVADATGYPSPGVDGVAAIAIDRGGPNEEIVYYSNKNGAALQGCLRGQDQSVARQHRTGESVEHVSTALDFREANRHANDKTANYVPHVQTVHKSVAQTIDANHTVTGSWTFSGPLTTTAVAATSVTTPTAAIQNLTGNVAFTGDVTFKTPAAVPKKIGPVASTAGTSKIPMNSDAQIGVDPRALLRLLTPAGTIRAWSGTTLPSDEGHDGEWAFADGSDLDGSKYPKYVANIGTLYGGTTAAPKLPNLNGRVLVGTDSAHAMGGSGGSRTVQLGVNELPYHVHGIVDKAHHHGVGGDTGQRFIVSAGGTSQQFPGPNAGGLPTAVAQMDDVFTGITGTQPTGGGNAFNVEQPWASVRYIIKLH